MIVGTGKVGMSYAYALVHQRSAIHELVLVDINTAGAEGETLDLNDTIAVAPQQLNVHTGTYADAGDCDLIVITAGASQKPGETRMDLLKKNAAIFESMISQIMANGFNGIFLVVSNPCDIMTYLTWKYSGLPHERIIGSGTVLDSSRLRFDIAQRLDISPKSVHAYQVGEHGDTEFALWSCAHVGGEPLTKLFESDELATIEDNARNKAYIIIEKKGATYYGIGACMAQISNSILNDEKLILPVSNYDPLSNTYYGYPAVVGRAGVLRRFGHTISPEEQAKLEASIKALQEAIAVVAP